MSPEISKKDKELLKVERTKLSLHKPTNHDNYFSRDITKQLSAKRLEFFNREVQVFDVTKKLKLITCPTLIICGEHDCSARLHIHLKCIKTSHIRSSSE